MINERSSRRFCSDDISLIENYQEAISDKNEAWDIHHRREIDEGLSVRELIEKKEYFHRPSSELIFLKRGEHIRLHQLGKKFSEKTKKKMSESHLKNHLLIKSKIAELDSRIQIWKDHLHETMLANQEKIMKLERKIKSLQDKKEELLNIHNEE